jgi:hypothetical protein
VTGSPTALVGGTTTLIAMRCPAREACTHAGGFGRSFAFGLVLRKLAPAA